MSKILIVEDDEHIRRALRIRMQAAGHETVEAADSETALRAAADERPELVMLDVSIEGGDGFTVAERLRADASTSTVPVIFLTASAQADHAARAQALGAAAFIQKPYDAAALLERVRTVLDQARAA